MQGSCVQGFALNDYLLLVIWQDINDFKLMGIPEFESKNHTLPLAVGIQGEIRLRARAAD